jgi:group I intron endonuclease
VGSSVNLARRLREYFNINHLERNKSMPICSALLKYGYSNFSFSILEYCVPSENINRENHYIDSLNPEYNLCLAAGSCLGVKRSAETIKKLSVAHRGKTFSVATRTKMSDARTGKNNHFFGKSHSAASLAKISQAVDVLNTVTGDRKSYGSGKEAAGALSCTPASVSRCLKSGRLLKKVYKITKTNN